MRAPFSVLSTHLAGTVSTHYAGLTCTFRRHTFSRFRIRASGNGPGHERGYRKQMCVYGRFSAPMKNAQQVERGRLWRRLCPPASWHLKTSTHSEPISSDLTSQCACPSPSSYEERPPSKRAQISPIPASRLNQPSSTTRADRRGPFRPRPPRAQRPRKSSPHISRE